RRPRPMRAPRGGARSRSHRAGLEHVELAALDRPFDVLRDADALLEVVAEAREPGQQLVTGLAGAALLGAQPPLGHAALRPGDDRVRLLVDVRLAHAAVALE